MKYDKEKMERALDAFMKNPAHKKVYEEAPSDECREFYKSEYYYSKYFDPEDENVDEFIEMIKEPEKNLSIEDWEYIKKHSGNGQFSAYIDGKIKELKK